MFEKDGADGLVLGGPVDLATGQAEAFGQNIRAAIAEAVDDGPGTGVGVELDLFPRPVEILVMEKELQPADQGLGAAPQEADQVGRTEKAVLMDLAEDFDIPLGELDVFYRNPLEAGFAETRRHEGIHRRNDKGCLLFHHIFFHWFLKAALIPS
jgi:hypothetical protein